MELEEAIEKINEIKKEYGRFDGLTDYVEAIDFVINYLTKQEKMIELMIQWVDDRDYTAEFCESKTECDEHCRSCIKQYFEKKAEESE